jgi:uncharacterized LabA/DUF88 family protein
MRINFDGKRIVLFADLTNLFHNINIVYPQQKLDYKIYLDKLKERGSIYRAIAYGSAVENEALNFIKCLKGNGYETNYIQARKFNNRHIIKYTNRTMDIAMDIIRLIERIDIHVVVFGSCNQDLIPLFGFLKEKGIRSIVYACNIPRELKDSCDEWCEIPEDFLEVKEFEDEEDEEIDESLKIENNNETTNPT